MFEGDNCQGYGKVVLAYPGRGETFREGSYWFVDPSLRPHLLALDTHTYWRLLLAHLGMPQWQALVAGLGLTPWARQWYEVVASYLVEGPRVPRLLPSYQDNSPASRLDPAVFRTRRTTHRTKHAKEHQVKEHTKGKEQSKDKAKEQTKEREGGREHAKEQASSAGEQGKGLLTKENGKEQGKLKAKEQAVDQDSPPKESADFDSKEGNVDELNKEKKASEKNGEGKTKEEEPYEKNSD